MIAIAPQGYHASHARDAEAQQVIKQESAQSGAKHSTTSTPS